MIETALGRCSADWKDQNAQMTQKLDLMLDLQRQRLLLDQQRLEFEREMAGLGKAKNTPVDSKKPKSRKRRKGNNHLNYSHFLINVSTQNLTLGISST